MNNNGLAHLYIVYPKLRLGIPTEIQLILQSFRRHEHHKPSTKHAHFILFSTFPWQRHEPRIFKVDAN